MDLLDIGGGFPGSEDAELKFEEVANSFSFFFNIDKSVAFTR